MAIGVTECWYIVQRAVGDLVLEHEIVTAYVIKRTTLRNPHRTRGAFLECVERDSRE